MQLDTSSSLFEPVVDDVSSGLDPSSSTYIVSSSYSNGNLVRSGGPDTATVTRASGSRVTAQTSGVTGGTRATTTQIQLFPPVEHQQVLQVLLAGVLRWIWILILKTTNEDKIIKCQKLEYSLTLSYLINFLLM